MTDLNQAQRWLHFAGHALTGIASRGPAAGGDQAYLAATIADHMEGEYAKRFPDPAAPYEACPIRAEVALTYGALDWTPIQEGRGDSIPGTLEPAPEPKPATMPPTSDFLDFVERCGFARSFGAAFWYRFGGHGVEWASARMREHSYSMFGDNAPAQAMPVLARFPDYIEPGRPEPNRHEFKQKAHKLGVTPADMERIWSKCESNRDAWNELHAFAKDCRPGINDDPATVFRSVRGNPSFAKAYGGVSMEFEPYDETPTQRAMRRAHEGAITPEQLAPEGVVPDKARADFLTKAAMLNVSEAVAISIWAESASEQEANSALNEHRKRMGFPDDNEQTAPFISGDRNPE